MSTIEKKETDKSIKDEKLSSFVFRESSAEEEENFNTSIHKIDVEPQIEDLEACISNFSPEDKEEFGIKNDEDNQVIATSSRS